MRHSLMLAAVLFISSLVWGQNPAAKPVKADGMDMPYKASLTTKFSIGSSQYSRLILSVWKDWDNNTLDNIAPLLADDVKAIFADGSTLEGKENFMKGAKEYRGSFSSVSSNVATYTTLKLDESDEHAVLIWGEEKATKKDGTVQNSLLHEAWLFNKEGKVKSFHQWAGQVPKK